MCLIQCDVCGKDEFRGRCTQCDHVRDKFNSLKEEVRTLELQLSSIQEAVLLTLDSVAKELRTQESVEVESGKLLELWDAAQLRSAENPMRWLNLQCAEHHVVSEAFALFRTTKH